MTRSLNRPRTATVIAVAVLGAVSLGLSGAGSADAGKPKPPPTASTDKPVAMMTIDPTANQDGDEIVVPVYSLQWGAGLGVGSAAGGGPRTTSQPSVSEMTVTRKTDSTSPVLVGYLTTATTLPLVTLTGHLPDGTPFEYDLTDVIISGHSSSAGGSSYSDAVSLNFTKITTTVGSSSTTYNLATGQTS